MRGKQANIKNKELKNLKNDLIASLGYSFDEKIEKLIKKIETIEKEPEMYKVNDTKFSNKYNEPLYDEIVEFIIEQGKASASLLQRRFRFGYNRAASIMDKLFESGIIGPPNGSKQREVLVKLQSNEE